MKKRGLKLILFAFIIAPFAKIDTTSLRSRKMSIPSFESYNLSFDYQYSFDEPILSSFDIPTNIESSLNYDEFANKTIRLKINNVEVEVYWLDNPSVSALKEIANHNPTIQLHQHGGFEQTGSLGQDIISNDEMMDAKVGDIVLYNSNQICLYYSSNTYSFTRLGHMNLATSEIVDLLSEESVTLTLFLVDK